MSIVVYAFVALIAAFSVLFGLDFVPAPMSPMPASKYEIRAAVPPVAPAPVVAKVEPAVEVPAPVVVAPAAPAPVAVAPAPVAIEPPPPSIAAPEPGTLAAASAPRCDLEACAAAYRTFEPSDCTYKPSEGPRRLCSKGTPPTAASTAADAAAPEARAQACNVSACSAAYPRSFDPADCTFRPAIGPRRVCAR